MDKVGKVEYGDKTYKILQAKDVTIDYTSHHITHFIEQNAMFGSERVYVRQQEGKLYMSPLKDDKGSVQIKLAKSC